RSQRASEQKPSRACSTARQTSSASVSLGVIPTAGRHGASWGAAFSSSSIFTYSAMARVSRGASTGPPRARRWFATPILDALINVGSWGHLQPSRLRPLGIDHLEGAQALPAD